MLYAFGRFGKSELSCRRTEEEEGPIGDVFVSVACLSPPPPATALSRGFEGELLSGGDTAGGF